MANDRAMKILFATDGSSDARAATAWLTMFPLPRTAELLVMSAVVPTPPMLDIPIPQAIVDAAMVDAKAAVDDAAGELRRHWSSVTARVVDGEPRVVIASTAKTWGADLIVMGARGLSRLERALLGSVSTSVARHAPCSVLVARGAPRALSTVVVGIDGSSDSEYAAKFFSALPIAPAMHVRLVGVVDAPETPHAVISPVSRIVEIAFDDLLADRRAALEKTLAARALDFEPNVATVDRIVAIGHPVSELVSAAKDADLIVVGRHGFGPVERLLAGSVSERVLHHASCSVLIVKAPTHGREADRASSARREGA
jgi:nucleotide-binding universal stress UspA family protein